MSEKLRFRRNSRIISKIGKGQVFGAEEAVLGLEHRVFTIECNSDSAFIFRVDKSIFFSKFNLVHNNEVFFELLDVAKKRLDLREKINRV